MNLIVQPVSKDECKEWILKKHYLKRMTSFTYSFGLFDSDILVGVCTFGNAVPLTMKKSVFGDDYMDLVYELNRLITNDDLPKNSRSFFVSQCLKHLPKPTIVVSYADRAFGHTGYIYQASNFIYTGLSHTQLDWKVKGMEHLHSRTLMDEFAFQKDRISKLKEKYGDLLYQERREPKHRYVYVCAAGKMRSKIMKSALFEAKPYPKETNNRYDTSFKPTIQMKLL
jgi:hypothetical protein